MNAAEAEDSDGAQLCWTGSRRVEKAARTSNTVFDLFDVQTNKGEASVVPCTVPIFDMAAVDEDCSVLAGADSQADAPPSSATSEPAAKQFQDDLSTPGLHRKPWAEVDDEDDPSGYRFFDVIAEDAAADAESQEHRTQCGPFAFQQHARDTLPDVYPCSSVGDSDASLDADLADDQTRTQCGPLPLTSSALDDDLTDTQTLRTQCGPLPHTPCALDDDLTVKQTLRTQCGPLPQTSSALDDDLTDKQTLRTQCGPLPHTPCALDDDLTVKQTLRTQCGPLPRTPCASCDTDLADTQTLRTQCGPLPQQHTPQPPRALDGSQHAPSLFDFEGITVFDFDSNGCLMKERTQHTPCAAAMPVLDVAGMQDTLAQLVATTCEPSASWDARFAALAAYSAATRQFAHSLGCMEDPCPAYVGPSSEGGQAGNLPQRRQRTQCGHLPLRSSQTPCALDDDRTQCGPVPQLHLQSPCPQTLAQHAPQEHVCDVAMQTLRTQCGPLPQQSMQTPFKELAAFGPSPIQAAKEMKVCEQAQHSPLASGTQCGPVPQQRIQTPCPQTLAQHAPQELNSAHTMPTPRTQCGPLPPQSMQTTFNGSSAFGSSPTQAAKVKKDCRGRRNGKGKGKGKGILPGTTQMSNLGAAK